MNFDPPLLVEAQRSLSEGRIVVRGPTGWNAGWVWVLPESQAVAIYAVGRPDLTAQLYVDRSSFQSLSSSEQFGFDPATTKWPCLRRAQHYSSLVLKVDKPDRNLIRTIIVPLANSLRVVVATAHLFITLPETTERDFLDEVRDCNKNTEHIVVRYNGEFAGFMVLNVRDLVGQRGSVKEVLLISLDHTMLRAENRVRLIAAVPTHLQENSDTTYSEIVIGEAEIASFAI